MLTKKDIKKFTRATVTILGKGIETKVLKNREVYEHSNTNIRIILPKEYEYLYIDYPTKKNQNDFIRLESGKIICDKERLIVEFEDDAE
jgi:hypothetical protein